MITKKRWRAIYLLLALCLIISESTAVYVGSGLELNQPLPISVSSKCSYSQTIFTADEVQKFGTITELWIRSVNGTPLTANSNNWTVFLGETEKNEFTSENDWVDPNTLSQVFSGTVDSIFGAGGTWYYVIVFDTPFYYGGIDNLVLSVSENFSQRDYSVPAPCYATEYETNRSLLATSATSIDLDDLEAQQSVSLLNYTPSVDLVFDHDSYSREIFVEGLVAEPLSRTSSMVSWDADNRVDSWYYFVSETENNDAGNMEGRQGTIYGTSLQFDTLIPGKLYFIYVKPMGQPLSGFTELMFQSNCAVETFPFQIGFENFDEIEHCLILRYDDPDPQNINLMKVSDMNPHSEPNSFKFTSSMPDDAYGEYFVLPELMLPAGAEFSFWYKKSFSEPEYFRVGTSQAGNDLSEFTWTDTIEVNQLGYQQFSAIIDMATKYVCIHYCSENLTTLFIDDIDIICHCPQPVDLSISHGYNSEVTANWSAFGGETSWRVELRNSENAVVSIDTVTESNIVFQNMEPLAEFTVSVQSLCDEVGVSTSVELTFVTQQVQLMAPVAEPFSAHVPFGWSNTGSGHWLTAQSYSDIVPNDHSGDGYFLNASKQAVGSGAAIFESPDISIAQLTEPELHFWQFIGQEESSVPLVLYADVWNGAEWVNVAYDVEPAVGEWVKCKASLESFADDIKVRFRAVNMDPNNGADACICIDDVSIKNHIACPEPVSFRVGDKTCSTAEVMWLSSSGVLNWSYYLRGQMPETIPVTYESSLQLNGLPPGIPSYLNLQANCADGETSDWVQKFIRTDDYEVTGPYVETFEHGMSYGWNGNWRVDDPSYYLPPMDHSGDGYFAFADVVNSSSPYFELVSLRVNISDMEYPELSFWSYCSNDTAAKKDTLFVDITVDYHAPTTVLVIPPNNDRQWAESVFDLTGLQAGETVKITFWVRRADGARNYNVMSIDDVAIREGTPPCLPVTNVAVSARYTRYANISWQAGCAEDTWGVFISEHPTMTEEDTVNIVTVQQPSFRTAYLDPLKTYYAFVFAQCHEGGWSSAVRKPFKVRTGYLSGYATIEHDGTPQFGEQLTLDYAVNTTKPIRIIWSRDGKDISGAEDDTYVLQAEDIGHKISAHIMSSYMFGIVESQNFVVPDKADRLAPQAPQAETWSSEHIKLLPLSGCTYCMVKGPCNDDGLFKYLSPGKTYKLYQYYLETDTHYESPISEMLAVTTPLGTDNYVAIIEVLDKGNPIENAEVIINGVSYMTNEDGIVKKPFREGGYWYSVSKLGYSPKTGTIILDHDYTEVTVQLSPNGLEGMLSGLVEISGLPYYGNKVSAKLSQSNSSGKLYYQWMRNGLAIEKAQLQTYYIDKADIDTYLSVQVSASDLPGVVEGKPVFVSASAIKSDQFQQLNSPSAHGGDISVSPNIVTQFATVTAEKFAGTLSIVSLSGVVVYQSPFENSTVLDLSRFAKGSYLVLLTDGVEVRKAEFVLK